MRWKIIDFDVAAVPEINQCFVCLFVIVEAAEYDDLHIVTG